MNKVKTKESHISSSPELWLFSFSCNGFSAWSESLKPKSTANTLREHFLLQGENFGPKFKLCCCILQLAANHAPLTVHKIQQGRLKTETPRLPLLCIISINILTVHNDKNNTTKICSYEVNIFLENLVKTFFLQLNTD